MCFSQGDPGEPGLPGERGEKGEKVWTVIIYFCCPIKYFLFPAMGCDWVGQMCFIILQGFRGFPGRTGNPGLDGEKVNHMLTSC